MDVEKCCYTNYHMPESFIIGRCSDLTINL